MERGLEYTEENKYFVVLCLMKWKTHMKTTVVNMASSLTNFHKNACIVCLWPDLTFIAIDSIPLMTAFE